MDFHNKEKGEFKSIHPLTFVLFYETFSKGLNMRFEKIHFLLCFFFCLFAVKAGATPNMPSPVVVAVLDSGFIRGNAALDASILKGKNFIDNPKFFDNVEPSIKNAVCTRAEVFGAYREAHQTHGTEVASLIKRVNTNVEILPIKIYNECATNNVALVKAIRWAAGLEVLGLSKNETPAKIINLSISSRNKKCEAELNLAIQDVTAAGVAVIVPSGNQGQAEFFEPANCLNTISVGAVDFEGRVASYSSVSPGITIYAPGGDKNIFKEEGIEVDSFEGNKSIVKKVFGTSFATAWVSGYVSLILMKKPELSPLELKFYLRKEGQPIENVCEKCDARMLNNTQLRSVLGD